MPPLSTHLGNLETHHDAHANPFLSVVHATSKTVLAQPQKLLPKKYFFDLESAEHATRGNAFTQGSR